MQAVLAGFDEAFRQNSSGGGAAAQDNGHGPVHPH